MGSKWKRAIKFMNGNKRYKRTFGWHPVCFFIYLVSAVVFGGFFLVNELIGEVPTNGEIFYCTVFPALIFFFFGMCFCNQGMAYVATGKSLLSFPEVKFLLTKGIAIRRLISFGICILPAVGMRILCMALEICKESLLDDMLLSFGIAYVLSMLASAYTWFRLAMMALFVAFAWGQPIAKRLTEGKMEPVVDAALNYEMPWWLVAVIFVVLVAGGTILGAVVLEHTYKKRTVTNNAFELRTAQR